MKLITFKQKLKLLCIVLISYVISSLLVAFALVLYGLSFNTGKSLFVFFLLAGITVGIAVIGIGYEIGLRLWNKGVRNLFKFILAGSTVGFVAGLILGSLDNFSLTSFSFVLAFSTTMPLGGLTAGISAFWLKTWEKRLAVNINN